MPALQIRDVPDDIYNEYKRRCAAEDRSMAQQTLRLIKMYLASNTSDAAALGAAGELAPRDDACRMASRTCSLRPTAAAQSPWGDSIYSPMADFIGREERIAKRKALFERIDQSEWNFKDLPDAVALIREDRDNDHEHVYSWEETA